MGFSELSKKMDENIEEERKESREHHDSMMKKMDDIRNENKLWREELRNERTKEIKNDKKPETEEIPNEKTKEQVVVLPEFKTNKNKENNKQR